MYGHREYRAMMLAFFLSVVAAVIIEYLLYRVYMGGALEAFSPPASFLFVPLVFIAFLVYRSLLVFARNARWAVSRILPLGIAGAFIAFIFTLAESTRPLAMYLIALVYYVELVVGLKLFRDIEPVSRIGSLLFVGGMALFILLLPVAIIRQEAVLAPMAFNLIKTGGLMVLVYSAYRWLDSA